MGILFPSAAPILPASAVIDTEDFDQSTTIAATSTDHGFWLRSNSGSGAAPAIPTVVDNGRWGIRQLSTGTTATGRCTIAKGVGQWFFPSTLWLWQCALRSVSLSTVTEEFIIRAGFSDTLTGDFANGVYFEYNRLISTNWLFCKAVGGVQTRTVSGSAVVANQWYKLKIYGVGTGQAVYKIDNITVGVQTDLPTVALSRTHMIIKSAGTTARLSQIDYDSLGYIPPASRD